MESSSAIIDINIPTGRPSSSSDTPDVAPGTSSGSTAGTSVKRKTVSAPAKKRAKKHQERASKVPKQVSQSGCLMITLPIELFTEIFFYLFPRDLLALARSCKRLFQVLVNPSATLVWRRARVHLSHPVPDPSSNWTEWAYAAFIFDGGPCAICKRHVGDPYTSFSLRVRVCARPAECSTKWKQTLKRVDSSLHESNFIQFMRSIPRKETQSLPTDPPGIFWVDYTAWNTTNDRWRRAVESGNTQELVEGVQPRVAQIDRLLKTAEALCQWRGKYHISTYFVRERNNDLLRDKAAEKGWDIEDVMNSKVVKWLWRSWRVCEVISEKEWNHYLPEITDEVIWLNKRRLNRERERALQNRKADLREYWVQLKSHNRPDPMPNYPEFCKLPAVGVLMKSKVIFEEAMAEGGPMSTMIAEGLSEWANQGRNQLVKIVAGSKKKRAAKLDKTLVGGTVHPADRVTMLLTCKDCRETGIKGFSGACAHKCRASKKTWGLQRFNKDEIASSAMKRALEVMGLDGDETNWAAADKFGASLQCRSCAPSFIMLYFADIPKHARRHADMSLVVPTALPTEMPTFKYPFTQGVYAKLITRGSAMAPRREARSFGCRHCDHEKKQFALNGLRSHLKEKHKVADVGDEDFYEVASPPLAIDHAALNPHHSPPSPSEPWPGALEMGISM
ncbi:hypothetical protein BOTBODRAFT_69394 [Botryobasidium botryosum FD-172 SS1]|uniref:F-box domain-containing protein n=1 Tax=Botryobasidium botryosum (strain FD-172 SS1) TaxID=930990 RepID=A0A067M0E0_BOTB1|nr:hypothetical protein BOTBODRAFT_69394 [Botryobasidium botryosum FD-172 SS1]